MASDDYAPPIAQPGPLSSQDEIAAFEALCRRTDATVRLASRMAVSFAGRRGPTGDPRKTARKIYEFAEAIVAEADERARAAGRSFATSAGHMRRERRVNIDVQRCGFCPKTSKEVRSLIGGRETGVYICNECVEIMPEIMAEEATPPPLAVPSGSIWRWRKDNGWRFTVDRCEQGVAHRVGGGEWVDVNSLNSDAVCIGVKTPKGTVLLGEQRLDDAGYRVDVVAFDTSLTMVMGRHRNADEMFPAEVVASWQLAPPEITSTLDVCGGEPCIAGTRIPVRSVAIFPSVHDALEQFPHLSEAQIGAALDYAFLHPEVMDHFSEERIIALLNLALEFRALARVDPPYVPTREDFDRWMHVFDGMRDRLGLAFRETFAMWARFEPMRPTERMTLDAWASMIARTVRDYRGNEAVAIQDGVSAPDAR